MKTKYLLMSAAFLGLFAACSQDDVFETAAPEADALAGRPVVGEVEIVADAVDTRYDNVNARPEIGDALGLYLMDEFSGYNYGPSKGEMDNANTTKWTYQTNWWTMYTMVDYIQSNYGYENEGNGNWVNRASQLVEGNYLVMLPKNDAATNRRDLWHEINPVVNMVQHPDRKDNYFVGRDNQFALDYAQIYRDQKKDENGKLTIPATFRYILTYAKFTLENTAANPFIATKLVFKAPAGKALPTVAYVKPSAVDKFAENYMPAFIAAQLTDQAAKKTIDQLKDECGNVLAQGLYDRKWFTQEVARSMVQYATTEDGHVPYGMTNEVPAYEYVFNFPNQTNGGVRLESNETSGGDASKRVLTASIALPAFDMGDGYDWTDMEVVVYGKMYDPKANDQKGAWIDGVLRKLKHDSGEFGLDKKYLWTSDMSAIPQVNLTWDDDYFYQETEIRVQTTEDLISLLKARLDQVQTTEPINFNVHPYGTGLEITDEVVKLITDYKKAHGVNVTITFESDLTRGNTPVILSAKDCIELFSYNNIDVDLKADQTIDGTVRGIKNLTNEAKLTVNGQLYTYTILNTEDGTIVANKGAIINATDSYGITNEGDMTLNGANVYASVLNNGTLTTTGDTYVWYLLNETCLDCGKKTATVNVTNGSLTAVYLYNWSGKVTADGNVFATNVINYDTMTLNGASNSAETLTNGGNLTLNGALNVTTSGENSWYILVSESGKLTVTDSAKFVNTSDGRIDVEGTMSQYIENRGIIYVKKNGKVIVNGGSEGIIDITYANELKDAQKAMDLVSGESGNTFQLTITGDTISTDVAKKLSTRISSRNLSLDPAEDNRITLILAGGRYSGYALDKYNTKHVIISGDVEIDGDTKFSNLDAEDGFQVVKGATLTVDNGAKLRITSTTERKDAATAVIDGKLIVNNSASLVNENAVIVGGQDKEGNPTGAEVRIETSADKDEWVIDDENYFGSIYGTATIKVTGTKTISANDFATKTWKVTSGTILIVGSQNDGVAELDAITDWAGKNGGAEIYAAVLRPGQNQPYFYAGQKNVSINEDVLAGVKAAGRTRIYVVDAAPAFTVEEGIEEFKFKYSSTLYEDGFKWQGTHTFTVDEETVTLTVDNSDNIGNVKVTKTESGWTATNE